ILSAGYRIGPTEIEDSLMQHPAVARAAVIGSPDPVRGEVVKAYLVLSPGREPTEDLARAIQEHVRTRLAAHEYPRKIAFVDELPMTATGKIKRDVLRRWDREGR
ncbi:MAG: AMP-dependent synthetase, partial [Candidatus Dadabacteria bacterium]